MNVPTSGTQQMSLTAYIAERMAEGAGKRKVADELLTVGWSEDEIDKAYAEALIERGVPVPTSDTKGLYAKRASTLDIVLNLFSFILLGIVSTALGTLYFKVIDKFFPDPLAGYYSISAANDAVHYAIAALIIAFPAYYFAVRFWFKRFREDSGKVESKLTKWITYLVLLVASVTIVGDLIAVLYTFLQGEITARFFLKALTVLAVAGSVFGFYFLERRKIQYKYEISRTTFRLFGYVLTGVTAVGIVLGFIVAGSPAVERDRTFDERRADDLTELAQCVTNYAREFNELPDSIDDLSRSTGYSYCATMRDPETRQAYEYRIVHAVKVTSPGVREGEFELCATFARAVEENDISAMYYRDYASKWYLHPAGLACDSKAFTIRDQQPLPAVLY